jgi:hypothetical protein
MYNGAPRQPSLWASSSVVWRKHIILPLPVGKPDPERSGWALVANVLSSRRRPGEAVKFRYKYCGHCSATYISTDAHAQLS